MAPLHWPAAGTPVSELPQEEEEQEEEQEQEEKEEERRGVPSHLSPPVHVTPCTRPLPHTVVVRLSTWESGK